MVCWHSRQREEADNVFICRLHTERPRKSSQITWLLLQQRTVLSLLHLHHLMTALLPQNPPMAAIPFTVLYRSDVSSMRYNPTYCPSALNQLSVQWHAPANFPSYLWQMAVVDLDMKSVSKMSAHLQLDREVVACYEEQISTCSQWVSRRRRSWSMTAASGAFLCDSLAIWLDCMPLVQNLEHVTMQCNKAVGSNPTHVHHIHVPICIYMIRLSLM